MALRITKFSQKLLSHFTVAKALTAQPPVRHPGVQGEKAQGCCCPCTSFWLLMKDASARKPKSNGNLESKVLGLAHHVLVRGQLGMQHCFHRVLQFVPLLNFKRSTNNKERAGQKK